MVEQDVRAVKHLEARALRHIFNTGAVELVLADRFRELPGSANAGWPRFLAVAIVIGHGRTRRKKH
jgi:hypothetical protein